MWCDIYVSCRLIEACIQVLMTTTPFHGQHTTAMWMWCGTCVSCLVIEAWIQVLMTTPPFDGQWSTATVVDGAVSCGGSVVLSMHPYSVLRGRDEGAGASAGSRPVPACAASGGGAGGCCGSRGSTQHRVAVVSIQHAPPMAHRWVSVVGGRSMAGGNTKKGVVWLVRDADACCCLIASSTMLLAAARNGSRVKRSAHDRGAALRGVEKIKNNGSGRCHRRNPETERNGRFRRARQSQAAALGENPAVSVAVATGSHTTTGTLKRRRGRDENTAWRCRHFSMRTPYSRRRRLAALGVATPSLPPHVTPPMRNTASSTERPRFA